MGFPSENILSQWDLGDNCKLIVREHSVSINPGGKDCINVTNEMEAVAYMAALLDGWFQPKFPVMEKGLHLNYNYEKLATFSGKMNVGVRIWQSTNSNHYTERSMSILKWECGALAIQKNILIKTDGLYNASEQAMKESSEYRKHLAIDVIHSGQEVFISPMLYSKVAGSNGTSAWNYNYSRVALFLKGYTKNFSAPIASKTASESKGALKKKLKH